MKMTGVGRMEVHSWIVPRLRKVADVLLAVAGVVVRHQSFVPRQFGASFTLQVRVLLLPCCFPQCRHLFLGRHEYKYYYNNNILRQVPRNVDGSKSTGGSLMLARSLLTSFDHRTLGGCM